MSLENESLKDVIGKVIATKSYTRESLSKYLDMSDPEMSFYKDVKRWVKNPNKIRQLELKYRENGKWCLDDVESEKVMGEVEAQLRRASDNKLSDTDKTISDLALTFTDPKYAELNAALIYCIPGVSEIVGKEEGYLYRQFLKENRPFSKSKRQKNSDDEKETKTKPKDKGSYGVGSTNSGLEGIQSGSAGSYDPDRIISTELENIVNSLPDEFYDNKVLAQDKKKEKVMTIINELADKETFEIFQKGEASAYALLQKKAETANTSSLKKVFSTILTKYKGYVNFNFPGVNPDFIDPDTKEKGTLPSIHQKIAGVKAKEKLEDDNPDHRSFGIYDGCGTGKTFMGIGLQAVVEDSMKKKGVKSTGRTVVICRKSSFDPWKDGLIGEDDKRYLKDKQAVRILNGEKKDPALFEELKGKKWIILNYEQLITDFKYKTKDDKVVSGNVADALGELGFDYLVIDESHNIRNRRDKTPQDNDSCSFAARKLAKKAYFKLLLTATPMFDSPKDYAVLFSILRPDLCPTPEDYIKKTVKNFDCSVVNARKSYFYLTENSIRRTEAEINYLENKFSEENIFVNMTDEQKIIQEYINATNRADRMTQLRKLLVDPKLVTPEILQKTNMKVDDNSSSKYKKLEDMLFGEGSLVEKDGNNFNDKFVIFSSQFAEGITRKAADLEKDYCKLGLEDRFAELKFGDSPLKDRLERKLKEKYGKDKYLVVIDGSVSDKDRDLAVKNLRTDPSCVGMVCTTETSGESINLSVANHAFFLDESYCPSETDQAKGRLLRRGQKKFVHINYLRAKDSLDEFVSKQVDRKRTIIKIAKGYPLLEEEKRILEMNGGILEEYFLQGGISIDSKKAVMDSSSFFEPDYFQEKVKGRKANFGAIAYSEPTAIQALSNLIGRDPQDCWKDEDIASAYCEQWTKMSVLPVHNARISELLRHVKLGKINFPKHVLSEGAGPSILYTAYHCMEKAVKKEGFSIPSILNRDNELNMLKGSNPWKLLGDMNGRNSAIKDSSFDMVDNASISLLRDSKETKETLLEANRVLKMDGILSLSIPSGTFKDNFYDAIRKLGFEVLTEPDQGVRLSSKAKEKLKNDFGKHYAESYSRKLQDAKILIAKKISSPIEDVNDDDLWFNKDEATNLEEKIDDTLSDDHKKRVGRRMVTVRTKDGRIVDVRK